MLSINNIDERIRTIVNEIKRSIVDEKLIENIIAMK